ncbi:dihydroneopterin aldolase [Patescibacteria group bacterium]|nr:dihydroneopterin aldolase [Patescibacteria group bacterium]
MFTLSIHNIKVSALLGFHEEEREKKNHFSIDVAIEMAMPHAVVTDTIEDTLDYATVYAIVIAEMQIPCHLLEKRAYDIVRLIFDRFIQADRVTFHIKKQTPLTMPDCDYAGVELSLTREEYLSTDL